MHESLIAINDYYRAFSTLEFDAFAPFFTYPCMFMAPQGTYAVGNRDDLATAVGPTIEGLRTKNYLRSEFVDAQLTTINEHTVLVRGLAIRYESSGGELERVPISYVVHQTGA